MAEYQGGGDRGHRTNGAAGSQRLACADPALRYRGVERWSDGLMPRFRLNAELKVNGSLYPISLATTAIVAFEWRSRSAAKVIRQLVR